MHSIPTILIMSSLAFCGPVFADPPPSAASSTAASPTDQISNYWTRHQQRVLESYSSLHPDASHSVDSKEYSQTMGDARRTLENVEVGNVHERLRDVLSEANDRYWQRRFETDTLPGDSWTPQQAGWMTPAGEPAVKQWPWWAW